MCDVTFESALGGLISRNCCKVASYNACDNVLLCQCSASAPWWFIGSLLRAFIFSICYIRQALARYHCYRSFTLGGTYLSHLPCLCHIKWCVYVSPLWPCTHREPCLWPLRCFHLLRTWNCPVQHLTGWTCMTWVGLWSTQFCLICRCECHNAYRSLISKPWSGCYSRIQTEEIVCCTA